jgi:subtilase family serine protease
VNVCSHAAPRDTTFCHARVRTDDVARNATGRGPGRPQPSASVGYNGAYNPAYLQAAYNAPSGNGAGLTVAIVDAYDNPTAESDLAYYRSNWGLSPCTTANGCFRKVDQNGGTSYPPSNTGWAQESALDVDMVSALCPNCKILLVEAASNSFTNLGIAVNRAATMGAVAVSNSYGGGEWSTESSSSGTYYNHPGIAITVSSGDSGYGVEFPAASQYVTAVGGTTLNQTGTFGRNATETVWSGAGSGCSAYEAKPGWQHDTGCGKRTVADVSAVADTNTPVWVRYNSAWYWFGGTSVAAPIVASIYALAGRANSSDLPAKYPYGNPAALNDVTSGSNGNCSVTYFCNAVAGYDGPTGLGTPNNTGAFRSATATKPSAPQNLTATAGTSQVALSWSAPSTDGGSPVTSYKVYRGTSLGGETLLSGSETGTTYTDSAVTNGTPYYYKVTAVNTVGESLASNEVSATPVAPPAPTVPGAPRGLAAAAGDARVTLSWSAPSSDGGSALTGYNVYRGVTSGGEARIATGVGATTYADTSLTNGQVYYYKVTAANSVGESLASNEVSAAPVAAPTATVPGAPTGMTASAANGKGVNLTWSAPSSNGGASITSYQVYRRTASGTYSLYSSAACTSATCAAKDTGTVRGTFYYYKVAAVNSVGTGPTSNEAGATAT